MIALSVTKRFIYLVSLGILILIFALLLGNSLTIFILYNLVCIALYLVDYFISDGEDFIEIKRVGGEKLSIYEKEQISFEVYNKNHYPMHFELKDEMPDLYFTSDNKIMKGIVQPHEKKLFLYYVTPTKRGAYAFGNLHIRYEGKLKLCTKSIIMDLSKEYKIYPNLKNLRKYKLSITNNRVFKQGQRNLRMLGRGTSFESLREYVYGDEYRKINWKATARENKPIINLYEPEKNQHVHILIDTGRPMSYTIRGHRKLDMVVNTALVLSDMINQNGDQSALLLFNTEVNSMIMPGKGVEHRERMLEALYHIDGTNQTSNYDDAFYHLKKKERHRSIVFLFTDFETVEEAENMLKVLPIISRNNVVVIVLIRNESLEEIGSRQVKNTDDLFDKGVALELLEERHKIISLLNKRGVFCTECEAEKLEFTVINKYIQVKNRTYL